MQYLLYKPSFGQKGLGYSLYPDSYLIGHAKKIRENDN